MAITVSAEQKKILQSVIIENGIVKQSLIYQEELDELGQRISKAARGKLNKDNLIEEIADVYNVITQLKMFYGINDEDIQNRLNYKINRTANDMQLEAIKRLKFSEGRRCENTGH